MIHGEFSMFHAADGFYRYFLIYSPVKEFWMNKNRRNVPLIRPNSRRLSAFGIMAMAAMIGFTMMGCDNDPDPGPGEPQSITYTGMAGSNIYSLKITENKSRAVYAPKKDDTYVLTLGSKTSSGKVTSFTGGELVLLPSEAEDETTFTVEVSGTDITNIAGTITWDDGETDAGPGELTSHTHDFS